MMRDGVQYATRLQRQAGLTLLEMLVVLLLAGIVAASLLGGLQFGIKAWEVGGQRSERLNHIILVQELIRKQLWNLPQADQIQSGQFILGGTGKTLTIVSTYPEHLSEGGLNKFKFYTEADGLLMEWTGLDARGEETGNPDLFEKRQLFSGVQEITFSYFGYDRTSGKRVWMSNWPESRGAPDLISVELRFLDGENLLLWPRLFVDPRTGGNIRLLQ